MQTREKDYHEVLLAKERLEQRSDELESVNRVEMDTQHTKVHELENTISDLKNLLDRSGQMSPVQEQGRSFNRELEDVRKKVRSLDIQVFRSTNSQYLFISLFLLLDVPVTVELQARNNGVRALYWLS